MSNVILHIGYHKCASSFLQKSIFSQLPINFKKQWGKDPERNYREFLDLVMSRTCDVQKFRKLVLSSCGNTYNNTVISHEELSGHIKGNKKVNIEIIADNLKKAFPNAKVIIIIRRQFSYIKSLYCYSTSIKGKEIRNFKRFCMEEGNNGLFNKLYYKNLIKQYFNLFSKENVLVLPIEMLYEEQENFLDIITKFIGPKENLQLAKIKNTKINPSIDDSFVINISRFFNMLFLCFYKCFALVNRSVSLDVKFRYSFYRKRQIFINKIAKLPIKQKPIGINLKDQIEKKYKQHNCELEKLIELDIKKYGYY